MGSSGGAPAAAGGQGEIVRIAGELQEFVGQFSRYDEVLRDALPRLTRGDGTEFQRAVRQLTDQLDESVVHQLSMLLSELWLYRNATSASVPRLPRTRGPDGALPAPEEAPAGADRSSLPAVVDTVVNLAGYAGAAAIGGVIGNRADAAVRALVASARERWSRRHAAPDAPLSEEEAVEVAKAAAAAHGFAEDALRFDGAELREDSGSWVVRLGSGGEHGETLTAVVPPGDPQRARVLIRVS
ncbi:hypothetical protein SUDANB176_05701 [Streptomyces sp. enrichment culture]|uniref:hypothetical protein n=1 Tax=Streptomyces sp. enrichment culture TaxID=1795815 RepID=UPI003F57AC2A